MAIYRNVKMSFWMDAKVVDDFTPEDKYFFLYLMTNPHTNLSGCYEISLKQMADETGYSKETIIKLLERMKEHKVAVYSYETKELLLVNLYKHTWTASDKFRAALYDEISSIKDPEFYSYLSDLFNGIDSVSIPYAKGIDTTVSVSVTDTVTDTVSEQDVNNPKNSLKRKKAKKLIENYNIEQDIPYEQDELQRAWWEYNAKRIQMKKPMSEETARRKKVKLQELATVNGVFDYRSAVKILLRSVDAGWQDIFPLPDDAKSYTLSNPKPNRFHNFEERDTDWGSVQKQLSS